MINMEYNYTIIMDFTRIVSLIAIFPVADTVQNFIFIASVMLYKRI